jgi:hypothetical protein
MGNAKEYSSGDFTGEATKTSGGGVLVRAHWYYRRPGWPGNGGSGRLEGWGDSRIATSKTPLDMSKAWALSAERLGIAGIRFFAPGPVSTGSGPHDGVGGYFISQCWA